MKRQFFILYAICACLAAYSSELKVGVILKDGNTVVYNASDIDSLSMIEPIPTSVTDIEGHQYRVGAAGNGYWMLANLLVTKFDTLSPYRGKVLPVSTDSTYWPYTTAGSYGRLYNWSAAMGIETADEAKFKERPSMFRVQGICPNKFHLPTNGEIMAVSQRVGNVGSNPLRSSDAWQYEYEELFQMGESPVDGFTSYPDGYAKGTERKKSGMMASYWGADALSKSDAGGLVLTGAGSLTFGGEDKRVGRSVRCVWDGQTDRDWLYVYKKDKSVERYRTDKIDRITLTDDSRDGYVSDAQGNRYSFHRFSTTNWMREDLRTTQDIPLYTNETFWHNKYRVESAACGGPTGNYYSIAAAMGLDNESAAQYYNTVGVHQRHDDVRGVCPEGWRLPKKADFEKIKPLIEDRSVTFTYGSAVYSGGTRFSYGYEGYIWLSDVVVTNINSEISLREVPYVRYDGVDKIAVLYSQILDTVPALMCRCVQDLQEPVMYCKETGTSVERDFNIWENNYPEIRFGENENGDNSIKVMLKPVESKPYILAPGYYNSVSFR